MKKATQKIYIFVIAKKIKNNINALQRQNYSKYLYYQLY